MQDKSEEAVSDKLKVGKAIRKYVETRRAADPEVQAEAKKAEVEAKISNEVAECHRRVAAMMEAAAELGMIPGDQMHGLLETVSSLMLYMAETTARYSERISELTEGQKAETERGMEKAQASVRDFALRAIAEQKEAVKYEIAKAAVQLPAAVGKLRTTVLAGALGIVALLGFGLSHWGIDRQAGWSPMWAKLRDGNDIEGALAKAPCTMQEGRKACQVWLWVDK